MIKQNKDLKKGDNFYFSGKIYTVKQKFSDWRKNDEPFLKTVNGDVFWFDELDVDLIKKLTAMNYNKFSYFHCEECNSEQYHLNDKCQNCQSTRHLKTAKACFIIAIIFALIALSLSSCTIERKIVQKQFICQELSQSGGFYRYKFTSLNYAYANYLTIDSLICSKSDTVKFEVIKRVIRFR